MPGPPGPPRWRRAGATAQSPFLRKEQPASARGRRGAGAGSAAGLGLGRAAAASGERATGARCRWLGVPAPPPLLAAPGGQRCTAAPVRRRRTAACAPSVRRAFPPVGTQSTVLQLGHTTTVCEWLNTVVLRGRGRGERGGVSSRRGAHVRRWRARSCHSLAARSHREAALALHVHEVAVGARYQALELVTPLLQLRGWVQEVHIDRQHLRQAAPRAP